jgi:hypothetical protein
MADGMSAEDVSKVLGITMPTFRKHYGSAAKIGRLRARAKYLGLLIGSAEGGNVSAQKHLEVLTSGRKDDAPYRLPEQEKPVAEPKVEKLGKKAQQALDAQTPDITTPMGKLMAERHAAGKRLS